MPSKSTLQLRSNDHLFKPNQIPHSVVEEIKHCLEDCATPCVCRYTSDCEECEECGGYGFIPAGTFSMNEVREAISSYLMEPRMDDTCMDRKLIIKEGWCNHELRNTAPRESIFCHAERIRENNIRQKNIKPES